MRMKKTLTAALLAGVLLAMPVFGLAEAETGEPQPESLLTSQDAPASEPRIRWIGTVNVEGANLNVRKGPSTSDDIIGKLQGGHQVEIIELFDEWVKIAYNDDIAYLSRMYVEVEEISESEPIDEQEQEQPQEEEQWEEKRIGVVTVENANLNVRRGPSTSDDIIGKLRGGDLVDVIEEFTDWIKIAYNGSIAWIASPYVSISTVQVKPGQLQRVIVLDPGHGGKDSGARAKDGTHESKLVWKYATKAKEALEQAGYTVYMTRSENASCTNYKKSEEELACRVAISDKVNADLYISIHADANPVKSFRGTVTFYNSRSDYDGNRNADPLNSKRLAEIIHRHVQPAMGTKDRGVQNANYYVNRMNSVPSVLIELAVLTNDSDLKLLKDAKKPDQFAAALVKAIQQYYNF